MDGVLDSIRHCSPDRHLRPWASTYSNISDYLDYPCNQSFLKICWIAQPLGVMIPALVAKLTTCIEPFIYSFNQPNIQKEIRRHFYPQALQTNRSIINSTNVSRPAPPLDRRRARIRFTASASLNNIHHHRQTTSLWCLLYSLILTYKLYYVKLIGTLYMYWISRLSSNAYYIQSINVMLPDVSSMLLRRQYNMYNLVSPLIFNNTKTCVYSASLDGILRDASDILYTKRSLMACNYLLSKVTRQLCRP